MEVFRDITSLRKYLSEHICRQKSVGLVPTMGALHKGHLSLLNYSKQENDISVCSIYINPAQFNNLEDLVKYPRQEEADLQMLKEAGCDAVFVPGDMEMYTAPPVVTINFSALDQVMEGRYRPGHFNGVALIVAKLFNAVQPDNAYFGQKDLQQFLIIKILIRDLGFMTTVHCVPIYRDPSGLALSSRNMRLEAEEKARAASIYAILKNASERLLTGDDWSVIQEESIQFLKNKGMEPEYLEAVDAETLQSVTNDFAGKRVAICVAAYMGNVRLIDNLIIQG
jgi:pantoate--beta-alanine ligase